MRLIFGTIAALVFSSSLNAQNPGTQLTVDVTVSSVVVRGDTIGITYLVTNRPTSHDSLGNFVVDAPAGVTRMPTPQPDSDYLAMGTYQGRPVANWSFLGLLAPSASSAPLYYESVGVPDVVTDWAAGNFPLPVEGPADTLPDDILRFNSILGKTVGVVAWPTDRTPAALLSRLRTLTQSICGAPLTWITDANLCTQLVSDLDQAETARANGQANDAKTILDHFMSLVAGPNGTYASGVTSPGYWVLVSNATIVKNGL